MHVSRASHAVLRADKAEAQPGIRGAAPSEKPSHGEAERAACGQRAAAGRAVWLAMADQPAHRGRLPGSRGLPQPSL